MAKTTAPDEILLVEKPL